MFSLNISECDMTQDLEDKLKCVFSSFWKLWHAFNNCNKSFHSSLNLAPIHHPQMPSETYLICSFSTRSWCAVNSQCLHLNTGSVPRLIAVCSSFLARIASFSYSLWSRASFASSVSSTASSTSSGGSSGGAPPLRRRPPRPRPPPPLRRGVSSKSIWFEEKVL